MALSVLQTKTEIAESRREMQRRGLSNLPPSWMERILRSMGMGRWLRGDFIKSWDVWRTAAFVEQNLPKDARIVDFGAYHSEILAVLHRIGFKDLHGIDLNSRLMQEPYSRSISYTIGDFFNTPYESGSFAAVTSISAIEHGHDLPKLLAEVARLLRPGGYFLCSTDYWPDKIDTRAVKIFDMTWTIFSADELRDVLDAAESVGLEPVGPLEFEADVPAIHHAGKEYTFAWFVLRKT